MCVIHVVSDSVHAHGVVMSQGSEKNFDMILLLQVVWVVGGCSVSQPAQPIFPKLGAAGHYDN